MANYQRLLDDQVRDFIARTAQYYPTDAAQSSLVEQRGYYDTMCQAFHAGRPGSVSTHDENLRCAVGQIPYRRYLCQNTPSQHCILYFHGGGFVVGGLESHDDVCAEICAETGLELFAIDYRLAPENPFPAYMEDAQAALDFLLAQEGRNVLLCGDSAGGNICAALAHTNRHALGRLLGQVLIYPGLGGDTMKGSYIEHAFAPMLTLAEIQFYSDVRGEPDAGDLIRYAPLRDSDFSMLPPTIIFSADCDPLRDDGRDYCLALNEAGSRARWHNETGLVHGYLRARHIANRARSSFANIVQALNDLATGKWAE